ncbi:hypothetical protein ACFFX0_18935 [Citricoccus parietis]|uniref:Integrase n=1 Tax=Citricoccus parietis TaxID=592307 RepID=A0ABV5G2J8_9MICC
MTRGDGKRIPGLYSVRAAAVSVFRGGCRATARGRAQVFGHRMGRDIAALAAEYGSADALERAMEIGA